MRSALLSLLVLGLAACQPEATAPPEETAAAPDTAATTGLVGADLAVATLAPLDSSGVSGTVEFRRLNDDVTEVRYTLTGLAPGEHGFHVHENATCGPADTPDDPDTNPDPGGAAGGHFNPTASPHGAPSAAMTGRHAGDFGNVTADADGRAEGIVIDSVLTFEGPTAVVGHAVIVHENPDDRETQPGGGSGVRLACGVAEASEGR